jgi:hypothetical protein
MVEIFNELKALLDSNAVLSSLNIGVITTALGSLTLVLKNTKTKIATITSSLQNTVSTKIDTVKADNLNTITNLSKEINVLKTQNDIQVKLLSVVIKHARWNAEAIPELAKTLAEYNSLNLKTVDKVSENVNAELIDLGKELNQIASKPVVETEESLVGSLFNDD